MCMFQKHDKESKGDKIIRYLLAMFKKKKERNEEEEKKVIYR